MLQKCGLVGLALAVLIAYLAQVFDFQRALTLQQYPLDPRIPSIVPLNDLTKIDSAFVGKNALCVGCSSGVGKGIAIELAKLGASVTVVGRNPSRLSGTLAALQNASKGSHLTYQADLENAKGLSAFLKVLDSAGEVRYKYLVMTVGRWPDPKQPINSDGINKVVALDLIARYRIFEHVAGSLENGARIMSVLASTQKPPPSIIFDDSAKGLQNRIESSEFKFGIFDCLGSVSLANEAWLVQAAKAYPKLIFIGMHPGIIVTDLLDPLVPPFLSKVVVPSVLKALRLDLSLEQIGRRASQILAHTALDALPTGEKVGFYNHFMEARGTHPVAFDSTFGQWLVAFLSKRR